MVSSPRISIGPAFLKCTHEDHTFVRTSEGTKRVEIYSLLSYHHIITLHYPIIIVSGPGGGGGGGEGTFKADAVDPPCYVPGGGGGGGGGLFKADAVNEEDPERDRATQV